MQALFQSGRHLCEKREGSGSGSVPLDPDPGGPKHASKYNIYNFFLLRAIGTGTVPYCLLSWAMIRRPNPDPLTKQISDPQPCLIVSITVITPNSVRETWNFLTTVAYFAYGNIFSKTLNNLRLIVVLYKNCSSLYIFRRYR